MSDFLRSYRDELQSAYLYEVVARAMTEARKADLFRKLGDESRKQSAIWAEKLKESGYRGPWEFSPSLRAHIVASLIRLLGPKALLPALSAMKVRGLSVFTDEGAVEHSSPPSETDERHRHRGIRRGGNLRAAVFGVNDGLMSNLSLIVGIAGATENSDILLMSGISGLLAGAFSMAAGEYISVKSQRELYEYQIDLERSELAEFPEEEASELALIYQAKGLSAADAQKLAKEIVSNPKHALDTLAREELGLNPKELGSPWGAAFSSFAAFAVGALIPVLPFVFVTNGLGISIVISAVSLFAVGASLSLFTGRSALWGGLRMLLIAGFAGALTYSIGTLFGSMIEAAKVIKT